MKLGSNGSTPLLLQRGDILLESKEGEQFYAHSHILQIRCPTLLHLNGQKLSSICLQFALYYIYSDGLYIRQKEANFSIDDLLEEIELLQLPILKSMIKLYRPFVLASVPIQTISYALSCQFERTLERDLTTLYNSIFTRDIEYKPNVCIHFVSENETRIWAHSSTLVQHSEYFSALLSRWSVHDPIIQVELHDISSSIFSVILQYMYIGQLEWTSENVVSVYIVAKQLIIPRLITAALENLVLGNTKTISNYLPKHVICFWFNSIHNVETWLEVNGIVFVG